MRKFTSLLLLGFALGSFAQTPGGVSGSELWFKTAPLNSDLQGYYRWQDFSGDSIRLMLLDSRGVGEVVGAPAGALIGGFPVIFLEGKYQKPFMM